MGAQPGVGAPAPSVQEHGAHPTRLLLSRVGGLGRGRGQRVPQARLCLQLAMCGATAADLTSRCPSSRLLFRTVLGWLKTVRGAPGLQQAESKCHTMLPMSDTDRCPGLADLLKIISAPLPLAGDVHPPVPVSSPHRGLTGLDRGHILHIQQDGRTMGLRGCWGG